MRRILVLGGTFNPVHSGHLRLGIEVSKALQCDRTEFVPCCVPPHKSSTGLLPYSLRVELLQAALREFPDFYLSRLEERTDRPSYTVDTLRAYASMYPDSARYFLLGVEDFIRVRSWLGGLEIPGLANVVVVPRQGLGLQDFCSAAEGWPNAKPIPAPEGCVAAYALDQGGRVLYLPVAEMHVSSTEIRKHWPKGRDMRGFLPDAVRDVLGRHKETIEEVWCAAPQDGVVTSHPPHHGDTQ